MKDLRILVTTSSSIDKLDGTAARALRVFRILGKHYDAHLATPGNGKPIDAGNQPVKIHRLKVKHSRFLPVTWPFIIVPEFLRIRYDLVVCESDWYAFPMIWLLSKVLRFKIIFEAHGVLSEEKVECGGSRFNVRFYQIREKFCIKKAHHVVALSEGILRNYERCNRKTSLVSLFIEAPSLCDEPERAGFDYTRKKRIGLIGPFDSARNMQTLHFVHQNINKFNPLIEVIVIGRCNERIEHPRLRYMGYIDSAEEYWQRISTLDAVLVVERITTTGPLTKILEPMRCGVPVFSTPKGVIGLDFVRNKTDIFVVDEEHIVALINDSVFNVEMMNSVGNNARRCVEQYYSMVQAEKDLVNLIESLFL